MCPHFMFDTEFNKEKSNQIVFSCENAFALFDSVEVYNDRTIVSKRATLYPYKDHIFDTLSLSSTYKSSLLSSQLYKQDRKPDLFTVSDNDGFKRDSNTITSLLCEGLFQMDRYLRSQTNISILRRRSRRFNKFSFPL
jgi:hypothetical protein